MNLPPLLEDCGPWPPLRTHHCPENLAAPGTDPSRSLLYVFLPYGKTAESGRSSHVFVSWPIARLEVFTAVTMKIGVFCDVTPCGSCKNRRLGEM
jgi:hypothetical protein